MMSEPEQTNGAELVRAGAGGPVTEFSALLKRGLDLIKQREEETSRSSTNTGAVSDERELQKLCETTEPNGLDAPTDLESLVQRAARDGAARELRLFACWCARQIQEHGSGMSLIELAERYANGLAPLSLVTERWNIPSGTAAAFAIAANHNRGAAEVWAAHQTLYPDAATAALQCAHMHQWWRQLELMHRTGAPREATDWLEQAVRRQQVQKLRELLAARPRSQP
jgi:hypothetical protein